MTTPTELPASIDDRLLVLPFYVVVDVSWSMEQIGAMPEVNRILPAVIQAIEGVQTLCDVVRLGAVDFADDAQVVLRLDDVRNFTNLPTFAVRGGTSYAAAFRLLRNEIEKDYAHLSTDRLRGYRPAVFFITDGQPTDSDADLQAAFADLTDPAFRARPNIILFGIGDATKEQLDKWVYPKAGDRKPMRSYRVKDGVQPGDAIRQVAEVLISSVVASANSVSAQGGAGGFVPPDDDDLDDWV